MRRAFLPGQGRAFCFLFLILCIPGVEKDDHLPKHPEKWRFFCRQPDLYGISGPTFILESFMAKDSSSGEPEQALQARPHSLSFFQQTLNKTLWALEIDKQVWHGELVDTDQSETSSISFYRQEITGQRMVENSSKSLQAFHGSVTEQESREETDFLVMHCCIDSSTVDWAGYNHSTSETCLRASPSQKFTNTMSEEALPNKFKLLMHPTPHNYHTMAFHFHHQCSWPREGHASSDVLSFFDGNRAIQSLELDLNSSSLPALKQSTLKERVNRLLDEKITKTACNQGMSREFIAKNMRTLPLQVHSLIIKGVKGAAHGFKVEYFGDFHLRPGQSTRLHVSYWPDLKTGIANGELQLVTSAGTITVALKANVPNYIQCFCQNAAFIATGKRIILQVCSLALFVVLLVFGRMLKQEGLIVSDASQWSMTSNAAKPSERTSVNSMQYHDNDKRSSIYVSIGIGCTHIESKQFGLNFTKALDVVHAAINCMVGLKFLYTSHSVTAHQGKLNFTEKRDLGLSTQHGNDCSDSLSCVTGKRRDSTHLRACNRSASTSSGSGAALVVKSKEYTVKNSKGMPLLDVTRPVEKTECKSPFPGYSDNERERAKLRKKKKGVSSLSPGMDSGTDSGSSSPLSIPSSPVTRDMLCRPVSPLCADTHSSIQKSELPAQMDATVPVVVGKDGSQEPQMHNSSFCREKNCPSQAAETNVTFKDSYTSYERNFMKGLNPESKTSETKSIGNLSKRNLVKVAAVRNSSKGTATTRVRGATLTASATFPMPGQRSLQKNMCMGQEDGQTRPLVLSSSSSDLVSTSVMAPHARAPGSPLSPKSLSSRNSLSSSPFTAPGISHLSTQHGKTIFATRSSQRGDSEGKHQHTQEILYCSKYGRKSPLQMHEPHHAQKSEDLHPRSDSVGLYNMWGDHFADLGSRWGPYWTGKETLFTRKPSSLPPLLQTPPFSVFSCNDPFNKQPSS